MCVCVCSFFPSHCINLLPSVKLQTTFLQLLNPSVIILALLLSDSRIPLLRVLHKSISLLFAAQRKSLFDIMEDKCNEIQII